MARPPRVYLIAQPTISRNKRMPNLQPLYEHGELSVLVLPGEYPTFKPEEALELIERRLAEFEPTLDFVAWAGGDTLAAVLTGAVLADMAAEKGWDYFCWLRYERGTQHDGSRSDDGAKYTPVRVPFYLPDEEGALDERAQAGV